MVEGLLVRKRRKPSTCGPGHTYPGCGIVRSRYLTSVTRTDTAKKKNLAPLFVTVANLCRCFLWARPKAGSKPLESSLELSLFI